MANLSVRGVDEDALRKLKQTAKRRGMSLNRLLAEMLNTQAGGGMPAKQREYTDLDALAATWSKREAQEFHRATASFEQIDEDLWR